jgi:hypothetical protein
VRKTVRLISASTPETDVPPVAAERRCDFPAATQPYHTRPAMSENGNIP